MLIETEAASPWNPGSLLFFFWLLIPLRASCGILNMLDQFGLRADWRKVSVLDQYHG